MKREKEILLGQFCDLATTLSEKEIEIARKHIIAYDSNVTGQTQKMFRLFKEIVYKGTKNYDKLKEKISKDSSDYSFNRLIRRTLYRFQESLIVDVNINRKGMYSEIFRKRFETRKRIMQAHILHGKGLPKMADRIYDTIIKSTKALELYDELIEALILKQSVLFLIKGQKHFDKISEEISFYNNCRELLQLSKNIYNNYAAEVYSKGIIKEKTAYLEKETKQILKYYKKTNSANILSQYLLLRMEYFNLMEMPKDEEKTGIELLNLLFKNKAVYSKHRISYVLNNLAISMHNSLNFEKAIEYSQKSLKNNEGEMKLGIVNSYLQQIDSTILLQKYGEVPRLIKKVNAVPLLAKHPFHQSRVKYQQAMNYFANETYNEANKLLVDMEEIEKDKEGWNLWVRIMRILCSIELLKLNLIDYDVESFRKYIQRVDKQYSVRKRDKLILSVLIELDRNGFDFGIVAEKKRDVLDKLKSTSKEYRWDPKSPELILFHDWFDAKLNEKSYKPNFEPYLRKPNKQAAEVTS